MNHPQTGNVTVEQAQDLLFQELLKLRKRLQEEKEARQHLAALISDIFLELKNHQDLGPLWHSDRERR